jgi:hypothetical protein
VPLDDVVDEGKQENEEAIVCKEEIQGEFVSTKEVEKTEDQDHRREPPDDRGHNVNRPILPPPARIARLLGKVMEKTCHNIVTHGIPQAEPYDTAWVVQLLQCVDNCF